MTSITIITIVVIALLTIIVFGLAWLGYSSCIKAYRVETEAGKHDEEIQKEYHSKKKKSGLVGIICSYLALTALAGLFVVGIVYKARGENLNINNQTVLVIKSGSMSDYYNKELADEYKALEYKTLHFDVGDICSFESLNDETKLVKGEVYGYKYKDIIITHRLLGSSTKYNEITLADGDETKGYFIDKDCMIPALDKASSEITYYELVERYGYEFRGDNNSISDPYLVKGENIIYHYTGQKIPGIGAFILYAQSYFGIWSLVGIIGIAVSSEIVYHQIEKINKARDKIIYIPEEKPVEEIKEQPKEKKSRKIKANFKRRDGTEVTIYEKEPTAEAPSRTHEEKEGAEDEK